MVLLYTRTHAHTIVKIGRWKIDAPPQHQTTLCFGYTDQRIVRGNFESSRQYRPEKKFGFFSVARWDTRNLRWRTFSSRGKKTWHSENEKRLTTPIAAIHQYRENSSKIPIIKMQFSPNYGQKVANLYSTCVRNLNWNRWVSKISLFKSLYFKISPIGSVIFNKNISESNFPGFRISRETGFLFGIPGNSRDSENFYRYCFVRIF